jgi:membrane protease YdiL (CAAX protease family)
MAIDRSPPQDAPEGDPAMIDRPEGSPPNFSDHDAGSPGHSSPPSLDPAAQPSHPGAMPPSPDPLAAPPQPSGPRIGTIIAWLVIIGAVLSIAALPSLLAAFEPEQELSEEEIAATIGLEEVMTRLQGRYLLGASSLPGSREQILAQVQTLNGGTPSNRMRIIALAGELGGPAEARARLETLEDDIETAQLQDDQTPFNRLTEPQQTALSGLRTLYDVADDATPAVDQLTDQQKDAIQGELGWFGRLALHPQDAGDEATRNDLLGSATAVVWTILGVVIGVGMLGVVGFIGLIVMFILVLGGNLNGGLARGGGRSGLYAQTFAVWMLLFLLLTGVAGAIGMSFVPDAAMLLIFFGFLGSLVAVAWPVLRGVPWRTVREDIGWIGGRGGPFLEVGWGLAGYAMGLPILAAGLAFTFILMLIQGGLGGPGELFEPMTGPAHPIILSVSQGDVFAILQVLLVGSVAAPIVEETAFRGVLYRHLRDASRGLGMVVSVGFATLFNAFIFAVIHPQGIVAVPALMSLAIAFTLMREYRVSLIPAMVMHGVSNGIVLTTATLALNV